MKAKNLRQLDLPEVQAPGGLPVARVIDPIPLLPMIRSTSTLQRATEFARELCGLQDKQIYDVVGIDSGHFSRIKSGSASWPQDERWLKSLNVMRTEIPVIWQVEALGYDWTTLRKHRSDLEQQLEAANGRIRELEHDAAVKDRFVQELVRGTR